MIIALTILYGMLSLAIVGVYYDFVVIEETLYYEILGSYVKIV